MRKAKAKSNGLRARYKRSDFKELVRGKYYERVKASSNVVLLDPEVSAAFPNSAAVNRALHSLLRLAKDLPGQNTAHPRPHRTRRSVT